jgi:malate/lactate dehydrogenase
MIANGSVFGSDVDIVLKMLDITPCMNILQGVYLELQDGAYPNLKSVSYHDKAEEAFLNCDVIVFVGGFPRKEGMERKELLARNGDIFKTQGAALEKVGKRNVKCLVVANPANTNCLIL